MGLAKRGYKGIMGFGLVLMIWKEFKAERFCFELDAVRKWEIPYLHILKNLIYKRK